MLLGIVAAFCGTFFQSLNYCLIKDVELKFKLSGLRLFVASHLFMGLFCLIPFLGFRLYEHLTMPIIIAALKLDVVYLLGQFLMFLAIKKSDPSVASPFLILKLPIVAILAISFMGESLNLIQIFSVISIVLLSLFYSAKKGIGLGILVLVLLSALCFATCDLAVLNLAKLMPYESRFMQALAATPIYFLTFLIFLVPFELKTRCTLKEIYKTKYLGISWLLGVILIVTGFSLGGIIAANIILSLRSLVTVILVLVFFKAHLKGASPLANTKILIAFLLFLCVVLYYLSPLV